MVKKNCGYKEGVFQISAVFQEYTNIYNIMRLHVAGQPAFFLGGKKLEEKKKWL